MTIVRQLIESACARAPLLLVIEDLHYAGSEEAARLGELAASVVAQPALLVLSTRPDEDPIDAAWRARARGCPLTTLDLAPLTDEESRELAASYRQLPGGDRRRLHPPRAGPPAVPRPAAARGRRRRDGDARVGAGARPLARREARARRPADAARGVRPRPALPARSAGGHAGRIGRRARSPGRGRPAHDRGRRDRLLARADARGGVRLAAEVAPPRAARRRRRLVRRARRRGCAPAISRKPATPARRAPASRRPWPRRSRCGSTARSSSPAAPACSRASLWTSASRAACSASCRRAPATRTTRSRRCAR